MRKSIYLLGLSCLLMTAACSEDAPDGPVGGEKTELKATFEQKADAEARLWPEGARVRINDIEYPITGGAGTAEARIGGVVKADRYNAVWPATTETTLGNDQMTVTLPNFQPYRTDNPGPFTACCGEEAALEFFPLCGTMTFSFYGTGNITTIGFQAGEDDLLSGSGSVRLVPGNTGKLEMTSGERTVFLDCGEGVELAAKATAFTIYVPAKMYEEGMMMIIVDDSGNQMNVSVPPVEVRRGEDLTFEALKYDPDQVVKDWMTLRLEASTGPAGRPDAIWQENDGVWINGENFRIVYGAGTREAEVEKVRQTRTFWASYPTSDQVTYASGKFTVSLPRTQTWDATKPYSGPMVAYGTESPLELSYLCGFLRLPITGVGTVYELKLTGTGIVGNGTAVGGEDGIGELKMEVGQMGELTIRLSGDGIVLGPEPATVYCVLPPGSYSDLKLNAVDVNGETVDMVVPGPLKVVRGSVVEAAVLDLRFAGDQGEVTDLSAEGTANCYVVLGPGRYSFPARKVSGAEVQGIATADWVWATRSEGSEGNELVSDIAYADGVITFTASTRKGNVLIAGMDANNEILWSWHLWLTDDPRTDEMTYDCGKTFLDRNLGAVSATPGDAGAAGVLYQWGRKDPFAGGTGEEDIYTGDTEWTLARAETVMNADYAWTTAYLGSDRSMAYAIAHPTVLLADNSQTATWIPVPDMELWSAVKTDNDPCPPGYRVPEIDFAQELGIGYNLIPGVTDLIQSGTTHGLVYMREEGTHFWPLAGTRWGDSDRGCYTNFNVVGTYWTISFADNDNPLNFNFTSGGTVWHKGDKRKSTCQAISVRCCKE